MVSLNDIASWPDSASGKASLFINSLNGEFTVALEILASVLEVTKPLSVRLQETGQDIHNASDSVRDCETALQEMRSNHNFTKIFQATEQQYGQTIEVSRRNSRQVHRENHPAENAEEFYRRSMFYPYLDICLEQLRERFSAQSATAYALSSLLPSYVVDADMSKLKASVHMYDCFIPDINKCFPAELIRWKAYWTRQPEEQRPKKILQALKSAKLIRAYPIIETLLQIFATLPVCLW